MGTEYNNKVILRQKNLDTDACNGVNAGEYVEYLKNEQKCNLY